MKNTLRLGLVVLAIGQAGFSQTEPNDLRLQILQAMTEFCPDSWCARGDIEQIDFRGINCLRKSCRVTYVLIQSGRASSVQTCQLQQIQDYSQALQANRALSKQLLEDVNTCFDSIR